MFKAIASILKLEVSWKKRLVLWLLLGGLLWRGIVAFWLYPGFDEAYYYLYSQHLDWSYFDHPLLVALTTGFGPWLTGVVSPFTIRLGTLILYTGSLGLLYLTGAKLFTNKAAQLTLAIATIVPIFQIGFGILTLPESPLIFFWSASLYCAACEFFRQPVTAYRPSYRLAVLGILVGLACLGKYHGFILALGLLGFCLSSPPHRRALISPWAGLGLILFFLTLFPLWFWNWQHDWLSFRFQLSSRFEPETGVAPRGFSWLDVGIVFISGIAYLFPPLGLPLWWVALRSLLPLLGSQKFLRARILGDFPSHWHALPKGGEAQRPKIQSPSLPPPFEGGARGGSGGGGGSKQGGIPKSKIVLPDGERLFAYGILLKQRFILWLSLPLIVGFTLLGGWQQILAGWPMPGFWGLTLLLGQYAANWEKHSRRWVRRWLLGSGIFVTTLLLFILLHITLGTLQKPSNYAWFGGFLSPENDPSTELIDIRQLRQGFAESPMLLAALPNSDFVFTNAYYLGGLIEMALKPLTSIPVTCFSEDMRGFVFWFEPEQWLGKDALYLTLKRFQQMPELTAEFRSYFHSFQEIGSIPIRRGGTITEVFYVYQAKILLKTYPNVSSTS